MYFFIDFGEEDFFIYLDLVYLKYLFDLFIKEKIISTKTLSGHLQSYNNLIVMDNLYMLITILYMSTDISPYC